MMPYFLSLAKLDSVLASKESAEANIECTFESQELELLAVVFWRKRALETSEETYCSPNMFLLFPLELLATEILLRAFHESLSGLLNCVPGSKN